MTAEAQLPVSAQVVGNAFAQHYYQIMHQSPELVHQFYQNISKLGRPEDDGSMSVTTTMKAINEKILSLNYGDFSTELKTVDSQASYNNGVQVLVTGYLTGKDSSVRNFIQSFFLAPQDSGYFVLNDMLRYVDNAPVNPTLVNDAVVHPAAEPVPAPLEETNVAEQSIPIVEEPAAGNVYDPPEIADVPVEEEFPVAEVIDKVPVEAQMVVESNGKIEEGPKKSYASIVMHLKESAATFAPRPTAPRKAPPPKQAEQVIQTTIPATDGPVANSESVNNGNNQEGEDGHSIYIKGLPMNATEATLEEVFKTFGAIKPNGIQVRSNRQQGFCFGFVEFEDASSVQKALEASPVTIGGRQSIVEEKKSTNTRGNNRGRYQSGGRMRNEGGRGGNFGGSGRPGYNRGGGEFNGRSNFNNRRGGGYSNYHRSDGNNQRSDNNFNNNGSNGGGRMNHNNGGMMPNGGNTSAKNNMAPRISASASN